MLVVPSNRCVDCMTGETFLPGQQRRALAFAVVEVNASKTPDGHLPAAAAPGRHSNTKKFCVSPLFYSLFFLTNDFLKRSGNLKALLRLQNTMDFRCLSCSE